MPAQIYLTKEQISEMYDLGEDVVVLEGPLLPAHGLEGGELPDPGNTLEVWVMDEESLRGSTHRSVVLDPNGQRLGDERINDDQI